MSWNFWYVIRTKTLRITGKEKESLEFLSTVKVIFVESQRGRGGGDIIGAANKDFLVLRKKGKILLSVFYITLYPPAKTGAPKLNVLYSRPRNQ
jgi:hypothetical protein